MPNPSQISWCYVRTFSRHMSRFIVILVSAALLSSCGLFKKDENYEELSAEELYQTARAKMSKRQWDSAIEILRTLEAQYPYGVYAEQAQLDTIYVYYLSEQTGLALAAADRFIKLHPTHASVDYAYYLKGLVAYIEKKTMLGKMMGKDDLSDRDTASIHNALGAFEEVYTPSTKAEVGGHDENISFEQAIDLLGEPLATRVRDLSLQIYTEAASFARDRGIIIADTKFEFGLDDNGNLHLIDEVLTPDSSRFWPADQYSPGTSPPSYDKQFVRDYLETLDWDKTPPGPELPDAIVAKTAEKYAEAEKVLTG